MAFLSSMNIVGSGLTAQQLRLDVISENITNSQTTRTENGDGPYRRKVTVLESLSGRDTFRQAMARAMDGLVPNEGYDTAGGVRVSQIAEDESDFKVVYDPAHPDADENGYVQMPNVDMVKEMADAMAATQAFSADATAFNSMKTVVAKAMEIGV
jgi:flagellar basal-body rod protein FlgC